MKGMVAVLAVALALGAKAFTVSEAYSDEMVLQRDKPIKVTGSGAPGEEVEVSFDGEVVTARADASGRWLAVMKPRKACTEGRTLEVKGVEGGERKVVRFGNVLVGDVWVCAGQSNMQLNIAWGGCYRQDEFKADAETNAPCFRGMTLRPDFCLFPASEVDTTGEGNHKWMRLGRRTGYDSCVGFIYGLILSKARPDIPIGIISLALGGSRIETWIPLDGYDGVEGLEAEAAAAKEYDFAKPEGRARMDAVLKDISGWADGFGALSTNSFPYPALPTLPRPLGGHAGLYNHQVAPLETFPFKGVLWYQGESNEGDAKYGLKQRALITSWRRKLGADIPFYIVQLPNFGAKNDPGDFAMRRFAPLRLAQNESLDLPGVGIAVTSDTNDTNDLHPKNKYEVAERLARMALNDLYGRPQPNGGRSPFFAAAKRSADGREIVVTFSHAAGGLANGTREIEKTPVFTDGKDVEGVVVTLADGREVAPKSATIDGETFRIAVDDGQSVRAVRYNCFAYPERHVWAKATQLPVSGFSVEFK